MKSTLRKARIRLRTLVLPRRQLPGAIRPSAPGIVEYTTDLGVDLSQIEFAATWATPSSDDLASQAIDVFRSNLKLLRPPRWAGGFAHVHLTHFDSLVSGYFNRELARAMALASWALDDAPRDADFAYLLEDAVNRHCACWEYLFQMLIQVLGFQSDVMPERRDRERMMSMWMHDVTFVEENGITHIRTVPKTRAEALTVFKEARKRLKYSEKGVRADSFFKRVDATFAVSDWLSMVKADLRSNPVRAVHDARNAIAHARPLSATASAAADGAIPGSGLGYKPQDRGKRERLVRELIIAHGKLEHAIRVARTAIIGQDIPNRKASAAFDYFVSRLHCDDCGTDTFFPELPGRASLSHAFCRVCGNSGDDGLHVIERREAPEQIWSDIFNETARDLERLHP